MAKIGAAGVIFSRYIIRNASSSSSLVNRFSPSSPPPLPTTILNSISSSSNTRFLSSFKTNSTISFPDSDDDDFQNDNKIRCNKPISPPYDPFNKKPVIEEPKDPKDLQEIFHKMRSDGLINNAIKMFDALSKDGLTHEAMELFSIIKDKGNMPDVVAHTAVIEAYANAGGHSKEALKVYMKMLAAGVKPNAYTYTVLIKGLSEDGKLVDAKKYLLEMMDRGIRPNPGTYTAVFEAFFSNNQEEEEEQKAREFLEQMKAKGFVLKDDDESAVREHLATKSKRVFTNVISLLFSK